MSDGALTQGEIDAILAAVDEKADDPWEFTDEEKEFMRGRIGIDRNAMMKRRARMEQEKNKERRSSYWLDEVIEEALDEASKKHPDSALSSDEIDALLAGVDTSDLKTLAPKQNATPKVWPDKNINALSFRAFMQAEEKIKKRLESGERMTESEKAELYRSEMNDLYRSEMAETIERAKMRNNQWQFPSLINRPKKTIGNPFGIEPRWLHEESRLDKLHEAMMKKKDKGEAVPVEWVEEYRDLMMQKPPRES